MMIYHLPVDCLRPNIADRSSSFRLGPVGGTRHRAKPGPIYLPAKKINNDYCNLLLLKSNRIRIYG